MDLEPGETKQVSCQLDQRAFAYWSSRFHRWVVEPGDFMIAVGNSSRHLAATETITVEAPRLSLPLGPDRPFTNGWPTSVGASS